MSVFRVILVRIFPAFSRIRTEYGEILCIFPYSVRMRENEGKMQTRISPNTDTIYAVTTPQKLNWSSTTVLKCYYNWTRTHDHLVCKQTLNHLVWLNGWVFLCELSSCGFESSYSHLNFRFHACFEQGVPWHSGNYRVWIHYK